MMPLIVMIAAWLLVRALGALAPWSAADSWGGALRFALAAMFLFTAGSHFHPRTRGDLVRMVPPGLPAPAALVSLTGVLDYRGDWPVALLDGHCCRLWLDRAVARDVSGQRPRGACRTDGRRTPRHTACLAPAIASVL